MILRHAARALRHACLRATAPHCINGYEARAFSQNGEDGILREIFRRIGTTNRFFVEFGVEDGLQCNTASLVRQGWSGLLIEGSPEQCRKLKQNCQAFPAVQCLEAFVSRENIAQLFAQAGVPEQFDLLSIDIDGNDYWVWQALASYKPRVVVIEYNGTRPPPERWVMQYDPQFRWKGDGYVGASLASMAALGDGLGYALIGTEEKGVNAFFLRKDIISSSGFRALNAEQAFHPNGYGMPRTNGPSHTI